MHEDNVLGSFVSVLWHKNAIYMFVGDHLTMHIMFIDNMKCAIDL